MTIVAITFLTLYAISMLIWWLEAKAHERTKRQLESALGEVFEYEHLVGMQRDFLIRQQGVINAITDDHVLREIADLQKEFVTERRGQKWMH